jgi:hypothetical protein
LSSFASASSDAFDSMTTDARAWTSGCAAGAYAANWVLIESIVGTDCGAARTAGERAIFGLVGDKAL